MIDKILKVLKNERECIKRQIGPNRCDRMCGRCDLCLPDAEILEVYDFLIDGYEILLDKGVEELTFKLRSESDETKNI